MCQSPYMGNNAHRTCHMSLPKLKKEKSENDIRKQGLIYHVLLGVFDPGWEYLRRSILDLNGPHTHFIMVKSLLPDIMLVVP